MPEHIRALIVILALSSVVFFLAKGPACAVGMAPADFQRRRNLWFAITLMAFLAHNYWVFVVGAAALLLVAVIREPNKLAMFFFLLFAVPAIPAEIEGVGGIRHFFTIHYVRLLILTVLLPAFLLLRRRSDVEPFGRSVPDKLVAGYIVLHLLLMLTASTFTHALRQGVFYAFIDIFLPYYVASRSLNNLRGFRDALMAFVMAAMLLSVIAAFEFSKQWLLYTALEDALGVRWDFGFYLRRGETLRAIGSTGQPIVLGYVMAVGLGLFLYLRKAVPNTRVWCIGLLLLLVGLIVPISRGPWVGAAAMVVVFLATGQAAAVRLTTLSIVAAVIVSVVLLLPEGQKILDFLPFVGSEEATNTLTYRQRLLEISIDVILQNPFFGAFNYVYSPAMQELKHGHGIIDIVNSYLGIGLGSGLVGLSLFLGFFLAIAVYVFNGMRGLTDRNAEFHVLGQALLSVLLGIMLIIFTVSSISVIPAIYWSVAGLGVAYARMLSPANAPKVAESVGFQSGELETERMSRATAK
jgi:O-antigen ligase